MPDPRPIQGKIVFRVRTPKGQVEQEMLSIEAGDNIGLKAADIGDGYPLHTTIDIYQGTTYLGQFEVVSGGVRSMGSGEIFLAA